MSNSKDIVTNDFYFKTLFSSNNPENSYYIIVRNGILERFLKAHVTLKTGVMMLKK